MLRLQMIKRILLLFGLSVNGARLNLAHNNQQSGFNLLGTSDHQFPHTRI